ncbi:hypothetical protein [Streptomyces sp. NPDC002851]
MSNTWGAVAASPAQRRWTTYRSFQGRAQAANSDASVITLRPIDEASPWRGLTDL